MYLFKGKTPNPLLGLFESMLDKNGHVVLKSDALIRKKTFSIMNIMNSADRNSNMYNEISVDDLREVIHGELIVTYAIEHCKTCDGLGYRYVEEGSTPSRRCVMCDGDGRVLKKDPN